MKRGSRFGLAAGAAALGVWGGAWEGAWGADDAFDLGRIEVTAPAEAPNGIGAAAAVEVIDAEELALHNRETVAEAVDLLPGVYLNNFGARNEQTISIRGFDLRQIPIYLDGIPIYVPYDGYADLGRFTTFDLAEIHVSKGFSSVLYGPNTIGGAVNLVSRRPTAALEGEAGGGIELDDSGSDQSYRGWLNAGSRRGDWYFQVAASYLDRNGYPLSGDFTPTATENGGERENAYNHDGRIQLKVGYTPNAGDEYALTYVNQQAEKGTPPYAGSDPTQKPRYWQWPYWDKESLYFVSTTALPGDAYVKLRAYYDRYQNSLFSYDNATYTTQLKPFAFQSRYDDHTAGTSIEAGTRLSAADTLKAALHYKEDQHQEHNAGEPSRTDRDRTTSLALEESHRFNDRVELIAGVSYDTRDSLQAEDYNSTTGLITPFPSNDSAAWNPQAGLFFHTSASGAARLTVSRKSRFATIKDRYSYRLGSALPNPDLDAERSDNYEAGYSDRLGPLHLDLALFRSDIADMIQQVDLTPTTYQLQNIGKVRAQGFEVGLTARPRDDLELGGNYTYLDRDNLSNPALFLTDVPRHKLFAYADWKVAGPWSLTASAEHDSERFSSTTGSRVADAFTVVNAKVGYAFSRTLTAEAGASNLLDEDYAYQEGFPEPGRTWFANLRYRF